MRVRVLKAPGGSGMEAERISCLLRKKVKSVGRADQPHPELEIEKGDGQDIRDLLNHAYELLIPEFSHPGSIWINPKLPPK